MTTQQKQTLREVVSTRMLYIPDYQRPFAWEERQLRDLWEDLDLAGPNGKHYAGTLVFRPSEPPSFTIDRWGDESRHTDVVDGQQRLTTCLLLLNRARRRFEILVAAVPDAAMLAHDLDRYYGILEADDGTKNLRLKPGKEVEDYWRCLLSDHQYVGAELASHRRLKYAAQFFDARLDEILEGLDDASAYKCLRDLYRRVATNLQFLVYEVESLADVGVIFETLNDRGHPLSELEKTKNYLLYLARQIQPSTLADDLAEQLNKDWATIFINLADAGADAENQLLRAHWLATRDPNPRTWKGVASIKVLFARSLYVPGSIRLRPIETQSDDAENVDEDRWKILDTDIREFARQLAECSAYLRESLDPQAKYSAFGVHADEIRDRAAALQRSGIVATYRPLLFAMRLCHPDDGPRYAELLNLCECYSARVMVILQYRTNAGQNRLCSLGNQLFRGMDPDKVFDSIRGLLRYWADDTQVLAKMKDTREDWYNRRGHKYFLYEYELHLSPAGAVVPKFDQFTDGPKIPARTTEHIYPQTPEDDSWTSVFVTPEEVALKHSLGNLVLTLDNCNYGNRPFLKKRGEPLIAGRPPEKCYAQSSLKQEQELAVNDEWTPDTIRERQAMLAKWALTRWHVDVPTDLDVQVTLEPHADPEFDDAEMELSPISSIDESL